MGRYPWNWQENKPEKSVVCEPCRPTRMNVITARTALRLHILSIALQFILCYPCRQTAALRMLSSQGQTLTGSPDPDQNMLPSDHPRTLDSSWLSNYHVAGQLGGESSVRQPRHGCLSNSNDGHLNISCVWSVVKKAEREIVKAENFLQLVVDKVSRARCSFVLLTTTHTNHITIAVPLFIAFLKSACLCFVLFHLRSLWPSNKHIMFVRKDRKKNRTQSLGLDVSPSRFHQKNTSRPHMEILLMIVSPRGWKVHSLCSASPSLSFQTLRFFLPRQANTYVYQDHFFWRRFGVSCLDTLRRLVAADGASLPGTSSKKCCCVCVYLAWKVLFCCFSGKKKKKHPFWCFCKVFKTFAV